METEEISVLMVSTMYHSLDARIKLRLKFKLKAMIAVFSTYDLSDELGSCYR